MRLTLFNMIKAVVLKPLNDTASKLMIQRERMVMKSLRKYKWGADMKGRLENDLERQKRIYNESAISPKGFDDRLKSMGYGKKKQESITDTKYIIKINETMYVKDVRLSLEGDKQYRFTDSYVQAYRFSVPDDDYINTVISDTGGKVIELLEKVELVEK